MPSHQVTYSTMKTLTVLLILVTTLLVGSFSSPMAYAMPMSEAVTVSSAASADDMAQHDCCEKADAVMQHTSCDDEGSFCQHCAQHCAGQIGLFSALNTLNNTVFTPFFKSPGLSLWQRSERLNRPPKQTIA